MPQLQGVQALADLFHMAGFAAEGSAVGILSRLLQKRRVIVGEETAHHLGSQLRVGQAAPGFQVCLGEGHWHIQAAVRRKAADNGFRRRNTGAAAACALIFHR